MNESNKDTNLYAELRFSSSEVKKSFSPDELLWLKYFYNADVPSVKSFLDELIMVEKTDPESVQAFKGELGILIENKLQDLLALDNLLDDESKSFLLKHLPQNPEIFSVLTKRYADPDSLNSLEAINEVISKVKKKLGELNEMAKTGEGLEKFMQLCDEVASEMGARENYQYNAAGFMDSINNLLEFKAVVNPEDVKRMFSTILYEARQAKDQNKRKGFDRLLNALEVRGFFN